MDARRDKDASQAEFVMALEGTSTKNRNLALLKRIPDALKLMKDACKEFQVIRKSLYLDRKQKTPTEEDIYVCECVRSTADPPPEASFSFDCKERCINRQISTECEAKSCPCGDLCNNRQFQLQQDRCVYPFRAGGKGWGLKAGEHIPAGSFIIQYLGEIFSIKSEEGIRRISKFAKATCTYLMRISAKEVIDPSTKGNIARFINHSCDPNCITQKWNVLGEVAVGIFAIKDIQPDEELTFDYKFDVYKTPFLKCLCGAKNCKGYLGLLETVPDRAAEELETRQDLVCDICQKFASEKDEIMECEFCDTICHSECFKRLLYKPKPWCCEGCIKERSAKSSVQPITNDSSFLNNPDSSLNSNMRSRRKVHLKEITDSIYNNFQKEIEKSDISVQMKKQSFIDELNKKEEFLTLKFILSPAELNVFKIYIPKLTSISKMRLFWNISDSRHSNFFLKAIELTFIGTRLQADLVGKIIKLIESSARRLKDNSCYTENSFKIPAIFLKRLVGEYSQNIKNLEKDYNVKISYNKNHLADDTFPIHFLTLISLKGRPENVKKVHQAIKERMSIMIVKRRYMARGDIKIINNRLLNIKRDIFPTEIRICKDNALRDINHPFYTIYYKDKEFTLIGTKEEVARADRYISRVIEQNKQRDENVLSLNYLIPVCNKSQLINIKTRVEKKFNGAKMIIYDPLHPRKNVSLTLSTSYRGFDTFLNEVRHILDNQKLYQGLFDVYQKQMLYQMSKYFFKYLQNFKQTNSMVFMKSWDTITADFDENSPFFPSAYQILKEKLSKDYEFKFYIIRVNSLFKLDKMSKLGMTKLEYLSVLRKTLIHKNEHVLSKETSIFSETNTNRLPNDFYTLLNQRNASISDEESRVPRSKMGLKTLEYSHSSNSNHGREQKPQRMEKRAKRASYSSSPEYSTQRPKIAQPHYPPLIRRPAVPAPPTQQPLPLQKPNSNSSFSSKSPKNSDRKAQKDSISSRDLSIHYRDHQKYRPAPLKGLYDKGRYAERAKPRRAPSSRSSSVCLSSSSISDGSRRAGRYRGAEGGRARQGEGVAREFDRKHYEGGLHRGPALHGERFESYGKSGVKRSK